MKTIYIDSNSAFYSTYKLYRDYIGYTKALTHKQWNKLPDNFKAAALYVQFYNEITLAWYKVKTMWSIEEEGVEVINQYLIKNVPKIEVDKKRFTPQYIYKVSYNCLYCLCIDPSKNKDRYYNEVSDVFSCDDEDVSWFDLIGNEIDFDDDIFEEFVRDYINTLDEAFQVYIDYVLGSVNLFQTYRKVKKMKPECAKCCDRDKVVGEFCEEMGERLKKELEDILKTS